MRPGSTDCRIKKRRNPAGSSGDDYPAVTLEGEAAHLDITAKSSRSTNRFGCGNQFKFGNAFATDRFDRFEHLELDLGTIGHHL